MPPTRAAELEAFLSRAAARRALLMDYIADTEVRLARLHRDLRDLLREEFEAKTELECVRRADL